MTVAVLVNEAQVADDDGVVTWQARTPAELESINNLVRSAVGFDEERGDVVAVESLRFVDIAREMDFPVPGWGVLVRDNIGFVLKWMGFEALIAVIILFVLRPLVGRIVQAGRDG